ncbi:unnamed protein product [Dimorphilus gyrociliatus]|uniref:Uncharacterized protein n=1 Tax=Dimorphilus gyrociliatus TaxID=2664684 RepID=A0A7I8VU79_9ANNE|nr:unnamed protein product [Dimorphilus gyrociliatus]
MSKSKTKIGRYSKERHEENRKQLVNFNMRKSKIPYLLQYSDAKDVVIICNQSFENFTIKSWIAEVEDFTELFQRALGTVSQNIYSKEQYMDVLEVTGVEIDHRRNYSKFVETTMVVTYTRALKCLRRLPGLDTLPDKDFFRTVLSHKENIYVLMAIASQVNWSQEGVTFRLDDNHKIILPADYLAKMSDSDIANKQAYAGKKITDIGLTFDEAVFLTAIQMFCPTKTHPHLQDFQHRFLLAFTNYLEEHYGNKYHERLQELISLSTYFKESIHQGKKWLKKNENYLKMIYTTNIMRAFIAEPDLDVGVELLKGLKI